MVLGLTDAYNSSRKVRCLADSCSRPASGDQDREIDSTIKTGLGTTEAE